MSVFAKKLKKLRKEKGYNQDELALALGVRKTTISNYETGYSTPTSAKLRQIADFFNVNLSVLLNENISLNEDNGQKTEGVTKLKLLSGYSQSNDFFDVPTSDYISLPTSILGDGEFFAYKISGNQMSKIGLSAGNIAILRRQNFADNGDIVLVQADSQSVSLNRIFKGDGYITLISETENFSCVPSVLEKKNHDIKIFGKVVKVIVSI